MVKSNYFFLNGKKYFAENEFKLSDLLIYFNYNRSLFVVEYNNQICNRQSWEHILIQTNDKIEIVTIVGGG